MIAGEEPSEGPPIFDEDLGTLIGEESVDGDVEGTGHGARNPLQISDVLAAKVGRDVCTYASFKKLTIDEPSLSTSRAIVKELAKRLGLADSATDADVAVCFPSQLRCWSLLCRRGEEVCGHLAIWYCGGIRLRNIPESWAVDVFFNA